MTVAGMRIAAGIMLIVFGALSGGVPERVANMSGILLEVIPQGPLSTILLVVTLILEPIAIRLLEMQTIVIGIISILLAVVISGGGICALAKRCYWWAFSAAVCLILTGTIAAALWTHDFLLFKFGVHAAAYGVSISMLFLLPGGSLALIFLVLSKGQFLNLLPSRAQADGGLKVDS